MRLERATPYNKGWYAGPWDSDLTIGVGFANKGIDEPHVHTQVTEIYLVARGTAEIRIEQTTVQLRPGDALILEPGEAHTFLSNSDDYFHFVIHTPCPGGRIGSQEKQMISRDRLGLKE